MASNAIAAAQSLATQPEASSSSRTQSLCSVCIASSARYTCPRCKTRTCSLPCSTVHKTSTGCNGERDKAAYIPMNQYGYSAMMNDYVLLEEMGRKIGDWGREILRGGFSTAVTGHRGQGVDSRGSGRGRGRERGRGGAGARAGKTKRDVLKLQLELRDIDLELLPNGMERRRLNQSVWDFKKQTAFLTVEFKFFPPRDPAAPSSQPRGQPFTLLTHRNNMQTPLLTLIQTQVSERSNSRKDTACPPWLTPFVCPDPDDPIPFQPPHCVMRAPTAVPLSSRRQYTLPSSAYIRFDPLQKLSVLLKNTSIVEFPTIEVHEEFTGSVVDASGNIIDVDAPLPKRRRINAKAGKAAIAGLLGGYGSDGSEEADAPTKLRNGLSLIGGYPGTDDEREDQGSDTQNCSAMMRPIEPEDSTSDCSASEEDIDLDPTVLLDLIRSSQADHDLLTNCDLGDEVDWGDDSAAEE